jgi:hypothetical protein
MKTVSLLLATALLAAAQVRADNILVFKVVESTSALYADVDNPSTTPKGFLPSTFVSNYNYYIVMALKTGTPVPNSTGDVVEIDYSSRPAFPAIDQTGHAITATKQLNVQSPGPLSDWFDPLEPLKAAGNYLWSVQSGSNFLDDSDTDHPDIYFAARHIKGIGTPLVISRTLTIPNVPRSITGKAVAADFYQSKVAQGTIPPYDEFSSNVVTKTWTLDTTLTIGANSTSINQTTDLGTPGPLAPGTVENGIQRVHNLLYAQGYRIFGGT